MLPTKPHVLYPQDCYERCVVLIRAPEDHFYCIEVPVRPRHASNFSCQHSCCIQLYCSRVAALTVQGSMLNSKCISQDTSFADADVEKLQIVPGVLKHSVYKDTDGTLW
jgi:hypothetical protein